MSGLSRFFGKKQPAAQTPQEALQKLHETEEMLAKKTDYLEKKIDAEIATAKSHGTKNKRMALAALKRKKALEKNLEQIDGMLNTIQHQRTSLENASMNSEILQVVGNAAKAMKSAHKGMDVDQVHELMEDISEQQEVANEIAVAISNPVGLNSDYDEDELMKELEDLEEEELSKDLLSTEAKQPAIAAPSEGVKFPKTPAQELPSASKATTAKKKQEDDDLAELAAWATE